MRSSQGSCPVYESQLDMPLPSAPDATSYLHASNLQLGAYLHIQPILKVLSLTQSYANVHEHQTCMFNGMQMAPARLSTANFTPRYGFVFMRTCTEHNVLAACFCYSYHLL